MLKTLIKKQLREMMSFLFQNRKNGKQRSKASILLYGILLIYAVGVLGGMFYMLFDQMCNMYFDAGIGEIYFIFAGLTATGFGVIGSIFTTYTSLYVAKDNEQLISLPIPPSKILTSRVLGCYITTLFFECFVFIPCYAVYVINRDFSALNIIFAVINLFIMPLLSLSISCILGWLIALIASKLPKNVKTVVTLLVSVAFLALYFYMVSAANDVIPGMINSIAENQESITNIAKYAFYPIFEYGLGSVGKISSFLISIGISILVFSIIHAILSKTFLSLATASKGSSSKKFTKRELNSSSVDSTLLKREILRLKSSPVYILNCSMGTMLMIVAAVFLIIKRDMIVEMTGVIGSEYMGLILCAALAFIVSSNYLTAPSISLEGKSIWIVQSCPVSIWKVLKSKILLHMIVTAIPSMIISITADFLIDISILSKIMLVVVGVVFPFFGAVFGLAINLKMPNLKWTNEAIAVKQGASVLIALFGSWVTVILLAALYILVNKLIPSNIYLILSVALILAISVIMYIWIKKKGTKIFKFL